MEPPAETSWLRVLVVAPYPSARAGLRAMLDGRDGIAVVGEATSLADLGEFDSSQADVLVVEFDRELPDETLALDLPAVYVGADPGGFLAAPPPARPGGHLLRDVGPEELAAAAWAVARGLVVEDPVIAVERARQPLAVRASPSSDGASLTQRERAVLALIAAGLPNKGIARELGISEHTVKFHIGGILGKLDAASRAEAVATAARLGLLPL